MNRRDALKRTVALTGVAISTSISSGFLAGCQPTGDPEWKPIFLNVDQVKLISSIVDVILPKTDTPGAVELHVPEFIDLMLNDNFSQENQKIFLVGIEEFEKRVNADYSKGFVQCNKQEKEIIINMEEEKSLTVFAQTYQRSSYLILKQLSLLGYFSSEYVMNNLLDYHPVAGRYDGCIPYSKSDKLYVDNN